MWPFSAKSSSSFLPDGWTALTDAGQFQQVVDSIGNEGVWVIFKHSYRCSISHAAFRRMEEWNKVHPEVPVFLVDVVADRSLSQQIASWSEVEHQSPQIIVLRGNKVLTHASHFDVRPEAFRE